ncbi:type VI secretion system Vgr family protein [Polaromonas sp. UC242_47]|uniref:type VI secretion system Vgr family protein n=1 Tax=Polaromonas sp. UC242_47 TaxID=3374626 RepID=UPI0037AEEE1F
MRTGYKQTNSTLAVNTPFGADALLLDAFQGVEAISQPFKFSLAMRSSNTGLDPALIIGASVTVKFALPAGPVRFFNGIVSRFMHAGGDTAFSSYSAELVPSLWLLTLSRDRVIYQNKTAADIVKAVLGQFGVTFDAQLTGTYGSREYCVQYDETALEFISRLMEEEGIFYFFTFADGGHTMVLGDSTSVHTDCAGAAALRYFPDPGGRREIDVVNQLEYESRLVTQKFEYSDYNYLTPSTALLTESLGASGKGKQFEYPGKHGVLADGTQRAKVRSEASQVDGAVCRGTSYCYPLSAGKKFTLSGHSRSALNTALVLRVVTHAASNDQYSNGFEAFPATVPFRPPRVSPLPRVSGSQTALVVGPSGEEIWTDKHGRIKVQFHWDRVGVKDENSSCWVRVSQSWAGLAWGSLFLPRIGQEVVISYVDGDPDRPMVTGCVYNGENTTPVTLPGMQTQSTIKSRSSKQGTAGNEMRMEDKKDAEEFYFHAQKDMKVEIENDLSTTLFKGSETHTLEKGDRTVDVQTGKETHSVKGTRVLTVTGNETHTNKADFKQAVTGNYELKVTGNLVIDVTGSISIKSGTTFKIEAGTALTSKAGTALTNEAGTSLTNKAGLDLTNQAGTGLKNKAGTTLDNEGAMVTNKASAMQTVDGGGMLTLKGGLVKIN